MGGGQALPLPAAPPVGIAPRPSAAPVGIGKREWGIVGMGNGEWGWTATPIPHFRLPIAGSKGAESIDFHQLAATRHQRPWLNQL